MRSLIRTRDVQGRDSVVTSITGAGGDDEVAEREAETETGQLRQAPAIPSHARPTFSALLLHSLAHLRAV